MCHHVRFLENSAVGMVLTVLCLERASHTRNKSPHRATTTNANRFVGSSGLLEFATTDTPKIPSHCTFGTFHAKKKVKRLPLRR